MSLSTDKFSKELVINLLQDGTLAEDAFTINEWTAILTASLVDHHEFMNAPMEVEA